MAGCMQMPIDLSGVRGKFIQVRIGPNSFTGSPILSASGTNASSRGSSAKRMNQRTGRPSHAISVSIYELIYHSIASSSSRLPSSSNLNLKSWIAFGSSASRSWPRVAFTSASKTAPSATIAMSVSGRARTKQSSA